MRNQRNGELFFSRLSKHRMVASIKEPKQIEIALSLGSRLSGVFLLERADGRKPDPGIADFDRLFLCPAANNTRLRL